MATVAWMLDLCRTRWQLHAGCDDDAPSESHEFAEADLVPQADVIRESLAGCGYRGEPIVVALGSNVCLAATLHVGRPQELRDRKTMLYRLEENIPWSVEECVGDYLRAGNKALMVAVPASPLAEFFNRLESLGVHIRSIVPGTLLSISAHLDRSEWPPRHVVAFEQPGWVDLVCIEDSKPTSWTSLPANGAAVCQELKRIAVESGTPSALVGYGLVDSAATVEALTTANVIEAPTQLDETGSSLASAAAAKIAVGRMEPTIELKRDQFGRSRGNVALRRYSGALRVAVAILLVSAMGALLSRGHTAQREADFLASQQANIFRAIFPNTKVPVGIMSRLESELAKLKGLQGDDSSLPAGASAVTVLHRMLTAMPTDRRFRLLEIRIEEGRLYLDGEVIQHGDAEAIAQRLRAGGFVIASPRTQRLDDKRVSLRITGTLAPVAKLARNSP